MEKPIRTFAHLLLVGFFALLSLNSCVVEDCDSKSVDRWAAYDSLLSDNPDRADTLLRAELLTYALPLSADSVDYFLLLQRCAVAAYAVCDWSRSDSLTDLVRAYCVAHVAEGDCRLSELYYRCDAATAICALYTGRLSRAIEHFENARRTTYCYEMTEHYYDVAINIADVYIQANRLPEAAENLRHGLYLCDSLGLPRSAKVPFFNALSTLYLHLGDYSSAMHYSDEAQPCLGDASPLDLFSYWCYRGNVYYMCDDFEEAHACFDSCYSIGCSHEISEYNLYISLMNRADTRVRMGCYDSIAADLDACDAYFGLNGLEACSYYLSTLRARILLERDHDAASAISLLQSSPEETGDEYLRYLRQMLLRDCYDRIGCPDSIVRIDGSIMAYKDSLLNNLAAMRVADVELRYKENMRKTQMQTMQSAMEYRVSIFVLVLLVLLLVVAAVILYYNFKRRQKDLAFERLTHYVLQEKLRSLHMRLSPHYLMNLAHLLGRSPSSNVTADIAMTLRRSLELSSQIAIRLADEVSFVKDYLRFLPQSVGVDVQWAVSPDVDLTQVRIPAMSLQLLVENAVKYAYPSTQEWEGKVVRVSITHVVHDGQHGTMIQVEDDGIGLMPNQSISASTGFKILTKTISFLNMKNVAQMDMKIVNKTTLGSQHGLIVALFVPDAYDFFDEASLGGDKEADLQR